MLAIVWSTTSGGEHHPLDGSTSMVQWCVYVCMCVRVRARVCVIIKSFHDDTRATIRLDGVAVEEINVQNGLRQGCCMAPVLFNLYTCLAVEKWLAKIEGEDGIGITVHYKHDFRRYTRNAMMSWLTECLFADDGALLPSTRSGAETAV